MVINMRRRLLHMLIMRLIAEVRVYLTELRIMMLLREFRDAEAILISLVSSPKNKRNAAREIK